MQLDISVLKILSLRRLLSGWLFELVSPWNLLCGELYTMGVLLEVIGSFRGGQRLGYVWSHTHTRESLVKRKTTLFRYALISQSNQVIELK